MPLGLGISEAYNFDSHKFKDTQSVSQQSIPFNSWVLKNLVLLGTGARASDACMVELLHAVPPFI